MLFVPKPNTGLNDNEQGCELKLSANRRGAMSYDQPTVVAEIGCNHRGDMETAKEMIKVLAIFCKVQVAKFQKRCPRESLPPSQYEAPHPNPVHAYGTTYGEHREFLEFNLQQHAELKAYCEELGIEYSSSVWDLTSAREIVSLNPGMIKIPSALNTHIELIEYLCSEYGGQIHVSTGMSTQAEVDQLVEVISRRQRASDLVLYSCVSGYPVAFQDVRLLDIPDLRKRYGADIRAVGFSGHHLGIAIDVAAYILGATWFERHFTLDRTWKGTDHSASLEPDGMRKLARNMLATQQAVGNKCGGILDVELEQREKLKWKA
jgi:sialic acid synthase